jgi:hypothetical protein
MAADPRTTLRLILQTLFEAALGCAVEEIATEEEFFERIALASGHALSPDELIERLGCEHGLTLDQIRAGYAAMEDSTNWDEDGKPIGPPLQ